MDNVVLIAYNKARELNKDGEVHLFKDKSGAYYLIIVRTANCKEKSKLIDAIYDEVYKYTDEIELTILIMSKSTYKAFADQNLEEIEVQS
ncbi:hypothetical protein SULI_07440 [Saccharolobus solfataricus]|uniref:Uncharacterized protein n=2 Tax=Saccharolobus solfataricus TaxID=2287 RepID=A0A0E3GV02_SACSO|nr:hypothetical protein [Saccharolobus solfataricus]AKA73769.1 hypothetical protein SULB_1495 [Saccharolobus solfataricus]AKA76466.1 hypothetical protein SULC_1493 [Saccharolobus solfataricus]AKA79159.1 hypothetical protein SULA_1494 [Saccharolobus solfataricus]AZF68242.1 hypothetical protein SULG_07440 [Saccharolobus solfataricus]AZF70862.1 hypothetical protein SULH_07440 [Saccharolobus solfataricus]